MQKNNAVRATLEMGSRLRGNDMQKNNAVRATLEMGSRLRGNDMQKNNAVRATLEWAPACVGMTCKKQCSESNGRNGFSLARE